MVVQVEEVASSSLQFSPSMDVQELVSIKLEFVEKNSSSPSVLDQEQSSGYKHYKYTVTTLKTVRTMHTANPYIAMIMLLNTNFDNWMLTRFISPKKL